MLSRALLILMALFCRVVFTGRNRHHSDSFKVPVGLLYSRGEKNAYTLLRRSLEDHTLKNSNYSFDIQREPYEGKDDVAEKVCHLFSRGVKAIVMTSPTWPTNTLYEQLSNLSRLYHVPFVTYPFYDYDNKPSPFILTIKPSTVRASLNMMLYYGWKSVIFLWDQRSDIEAAMFKKEMDPYDISLLAFSAFNTSDVAVEEILTLQEGFVEEELHAVLLTSPTLSIEIVTAYAKLNIKRSHVLLVEPFIAGDWTNSFDNKYLKVTRFNLVDPESTKFEVLNSATHASSEDSLLSVEAGAILGAAFNRLHQRNPATFANEGTWIEFTPCSSDIPPVPSIHGLALSVDMKKSKGVEGYSGNLQFDSRGRRRNYMLHVMETTSEGDVEIATWSDRNGLKMNFRQMSFPVQNITQYSKRNEERYTITSILEPPYLSKHGNRYVGFCAELLHHLSSRIKFKYDLKLVGDGNYGFYDYRTGKWNGMIGEIIDGVADLAVAPLMITSRRSLVVDFTVPFENQGIALLMKNVKKSSPLRHVVFYPFTWQLWAFLFSVYVAFGVFAVLLYRYTNSSRYQNQHDMTSWCSRSWPLRVLFLVCLVFTIVIVSIYIASLGIILSHQRTTWSETKRLDFKDVFRQSILTGTPKILLLRGRNIVSFFQRSKDSLYRRYWNQVSADSTHFVLTYREGIQRVIESNGETAIVINEAAGEYLSKENCDLKVVKGAANVKNYAIALRLNHPLRQSLNEAIMSLRENGTLDYLYEKWWKSKCPNNHDTENSQSHLRPVQLRDVDGVFYMLAVGFGLVLLTTVMHLFYCKQRISSQSDSRTFLCRDQDDASMKISSPLGSLKRIGVDKNPK